MPATARPYRLPWQDVDAPVVWLKVTARCDITCAGCVPAAGPRCDVPVDALRERLRDVVTWTTPSAVALVGGEPLLHADLARLLWMVRHDFGLPPVLATNGLALDEDRLPALVRAGLAGVALQVDATQRRRGGLPSTVGQRRAERQRLLRLLDDTPLTVSLHTLVDDSSLDEALDIAELASHHPRVVHELVFRVRDTRTAGDTRPSLRARLLRALTHADPEFRPAAWRPGNAQAGDDAQDLAARVLTEGKVLGYLGPRAFEVLHTAHHLFAGRWARTADVARVSGSALLSALAPLDPGARATLGRWLGDAVFGTRHRLRDLHLQTLVVTEAVAGDSPGVCQGHPACPAFA